MQNDEVGYYNAERSVDRETGNNCIFYKEHKDSRMWWVDYPDIVGDFAVTFDKQKILHIFRDYPAAFTPDEKEIFDNEAPYWKNFFKDRQAV